ncbi:D-2-hydroxyacid dehydrogenase [Helicobacter sp. faydin-H20]|uniref:D-2-hydroxyacid dehydrogenase n=1 Tax=Helicobacter anatolicus TaxID=2905874 RepID=UPI001E31D9D3|nr:D-2-hydroxyacid dehydrogenase [Helicobacter anatolicus]MCE3037323.1 D-2-hydroxyacid dehydrogenase [Helicobacter anatolicus]
MKIVCLDAKTLGDVSLDSLKEYGEFISYPTTSTQEIYDRIQDATIVLTNKVPLKKEILQQCPHLKLIAIMATGMDIVDVAYAQEQGIVVKNVAGYSTKSVAQHTLVLALNLLSNLSYYDTYCKSGDWTKSDIFTHIQDGLAQLDSKQWGIIGLGSIGKEVAKLAEAFGAQISYTSISQNKQDTHYTYKDLDTLLKTSDIISIHSPLTTQTKDLLNAKKLALLKDKAVLINVGRGGIVNEEDMAKELLMREIYFGTDVLEKEPMQKNHPFLNPLLHKKIIITPHIAWAYENSKNVLVQKILQNIKDFLQE